MKNACLFIFGAVLILGLITLGMSLIIASLAPNVLLVYLTANPSSFSHEILYPNMAAPYLFSAIEIAVGAVGVWFACKRVR